MSFTSPTDSPSFRFQRVIVEVSTRPSAPPSRKRAAPLAADTVPILVPISHTGASDTARSAAIIARMSSACSLLARKRLSPLA